jgi:hypothetical protein
VQTKLYIDGEFTDGLDVPRTAAAYRYFGGKSVRINVDGPVPDWYAR